LRERVPERIERPPHAGGADSYELGLRTDRHGKDARQNRDGQDFQVQGQI